VGRAAINCYSCTGARADSRRIPYHIGAQPIFLQAGADEFVALNADVTVVKVMARIFFAIRDRNRAIWNTAVGRDIREDCDWIRTGEHGWIHRWPQSAESKIERKADVKMNEEDGSLSGKLSVLFPGRGLCEKKRDCSIRMRRSERNFWKTR